MKQEIKLTIIGTGMDINGELISQDDIRIDGKFFGDIETSGKIVISNKGFVDGNIKGKNITVHGEAKGEVIATNNFCMAPGGTFKGSVKTKYINITELAYFNGTCVIESSMINDTLRNKNSIVPCIRKELKELKNADNKIKKIPNEDQIPSHQKVVESEKSTAIMNNTISKIKSL